ncbi:MAG: sensor histidine kinase, partial [Ruminococcus sp.]|nr:sensor histidine kinase [Ruminococcus sp.]
MKSGKYSKILLGLVRFFTFFMLIAFVVTCSFMLFLNSMEFDLEILKNKAILTFANVILLTLILWVIDSVRRKLTGDRHVRNIIQGLDKITKGDFTGKIDVPQETGNEFGIIIK